MGLYLGGQFGHNDIVGLFSGFVVLECLGEERLDRDGGVERVLGEVSESGECLAVEYIQTEWYHVNEP